MSEDASTEFKGMTKGLNSYHSFKSNRVRLKLGAYKHHSPYVAHPARSFLKSLATATWLTL